ncbi:MAG TPA: FtsK/SpoIIIE domain-containing protein, partial [Streptosporangiaceae bacterium]|nr:FtsK/SpoIIIE domain-containing protein [Streptosporangiaceae bacterium]
MTRYRQMRRHARQARRAGMQPIMITSTGDPLPELAAAAAARLAWHYRSELAPLGAGLLVAGLGWLAHAALPHWWPLILTFSAASAAVPCALGARTGPRTMTERIYLALTVLACGTWDGLAAAAGPRTPPLPQALGIGTLILAIPWWANRRRRAKVQVERTIAAWPDIARAVGLAGSEIMNATVDLWGWRARLRLARGQTITDVSAKIPALESGFGTHRNAIRVLPTPDDLANRCELRILNQDPHANAITWHGPSVTSITQPVDLGPFEDAEPCRVLFLRRHALLAGATGSGKSGGLNELMANLAACGDVIIWAIDLKRGMELQPWEPCIDRLATTPPEAAALLSDAVTILYGRADQLARHGKREWAPSPAMPALVIIIDEYAELDEHAMDHADTIARLGRAPAVTLVAATQRPTQDVMGRSAVRSQMNIRIAFRVEEQRDVDLILGQGKRKAGWHADTLNAPGKFLISAPEHTTPRRARAYLVTDDDVRDAVARYAPIRPRLDSISCQALAAGPQQTRPQPPRAPGRAASDAPPASGEDRRQDPDAILRRALAA